MGIHTNHPEELYPKVISSLRMLAETPINLVSQTVLLKRVNDNVETLTTLFKMLAENRVTPYYLHHPDKVKGAMHFYIPLRIGREIYARLRDELAGFMLPHYVIDPSNGKGKTFAYNPESLEYSGKLLDRFNQQYTYPEEP